MYRSVKRKQQRHIIRFPWLIWGVTTAFVTFQFILQSSSGVMAKEWMYSFQIEADYVGQLSASFFITYLLMQMPVGLLIDKYKSRWLLSTAALICSCGCALFALTNHYAVAVLARMMMGLGASFAFVGMLYAVGSWFSAKRFSFMIGLSEMLGMIGTGFGVFAIAFVVNVWSWRIALAICAVIAFCIAVLIVYFIRDRAAKPIYSVDASITKLKLRDALKLVLPNKQLWFNGLSNGFLFTSISVYAALWSVPFLMRAHYLTESQAALVNSMVFVGIAIGSLVWSWLSHHFARRKPLCLTGCIGSFIVLALILYTPALPLYLLFILLLLLGFFSSTYLQCFAIAHEITARHIRGTAMGLTNMLSVLGGPIIQPAVGYVLTIGWSGGQTQRGVPIYSVANYQLALAIVLCCFAVAFFLMLWVKETHCRAV
jgi:MFS family permease